MRSERIQKNFFWTEKCFPVLQSTGMGNVEEAIVHGNVSSVVDILSLRRDPNIMFLSAFVEKKEDSRFLS